MIFETQNQAHGTALLLLWLCCSTFSKEFHQGQIQVPSCDLEGVPLFGLFPSLRYQLLPLPLHVTVASLAFFSFLESLARSHFRAHAFAVSSAWRSCSWPSPDSPINFSQVSASMSLPLSGLLLSSHLELPLKLPVLSLLYCFSKHSPLSEISRECKHDGTMAEQRTGEPMPTATLCADSLPLGEAK